MNRSVDKYPLIIFLLWFIFFFLPVGNRGLWNPDEPRYLQVAWEMVNANAYLIPIFNGDLYAHKPPLFFWLTILMSKISAFETASRYVSALMSLGTIFLTYLMGKRYGGPRIGFTAALILMTTGLFLWLMGTGNIDTTLTFFTTLALYGFLLYEEKKKWFWIFLAYTSCGIGILVKGPVALLTPWLIFLIWTIHRRSFKKENIPYLHLTWGPAIALGIAAIWVLPACFIGGESYTKELLITHNIGRAIDSFAHESPWYYYFLNFPGMFAPWSLVFLTVLFHLKTELTESRRPFHFYFVWFVGSIFFFTLFSGKRSQYLLPAYPAFSLVLAHAIYMWDQKKESSFFLKLTVILVFGCGILLFLFPPALLIFKDKTTLFSDITFTISGWRLWAIYGIGILPLFLLWDSFKKLRDKMNTDAVISFAVSILLYLGIAQISMIPNIDPFKSVKYFVNDIEGKLSKQSTVAFFDDYSQSGWNFYLKRPVIPVVEPYEASNVSPPMDFAISEDKYNAQAYLSMKDNPPMEQIDYYGYKIVYKKRIGGKEYTLWKLKNTQ